MRLFLDTEFNGFGGELISIALVPEDNSTGVFYEYLGLPSDVHPWVLANVVPYLPPGPGHSESAVRASLATYLSKFSDVHVVADWPEGVIHLCRLILLNEPGKRINTPPLTMEIMRVDYTSSNPHHAMYDALAFREEVLKRERNRDLVMRALVSQPDVLGKLHRRITSGDSPTDWL